MPGNDRTGTWSEDVDLLLTSILISSGAEFIYGDTD